MNQRIFVNSSNVQASHCFDNAPSSSLDTKHCHDNYEILYIISGSGQYLIEGSVYDIKPGSLMLIRPFVYHSVRLDQNVPYERYVINFSTDGLVSDAVALLHGIIDQDDDEPGGRYYRSSALPQAALNVFDRFENVIPMAQSNRKIYSATLISELIVLLSITKCEKIYHNDEELGARVVRYLNENIDRDISLDKLAKIFFVSKYYLCRAFKKHNGISIHGYINQKRVMYAKQLIESGETASSAAYRVGFGDYSSFYRAYVKVIGKSPTAP